MLGTGAAVDRSATVQVALPRRMELTELQLSPRLPLLHAAPWSLLLVRPPQRSRQPLPPAWLPYPHQTLQCLLRHRAQQQLVQGLRRPPRRVKRQHVAPLPRGATRQHCKHGASAPVLPPPFASSLLVC